MTSSTTLGFFFVLFSIICGGSWGAPSKIQSIKDCKLDPIVFQFYNTLGVFLSSWVLQALLPINDKLVNGGGNKFEIPYLGFISGVLFVISVAAAIVGYNKIGIALLSGISCGCTILSSWLWGVVAFKERPLRPLFSIIGICILVIAVFGISFCKDISRHWITASLLNGMCGHQHRSPRNDADHPLSFEAFEMRSHTALNINLLGTSNPMKSDGPSSQEPVPDMDRSVALSVSDGVCLNSGHSALNLLSVAPFPRTETMLTTESNAGLSSAERMTKVCQGIMLACLSGLAGGSGWVPLNYLPASAQGVAFLPSFAIGCLATSGVTLGLHCCISSHRLQFHLRDTLGMGILSGVIVNICALTTVTGITYLGYSLAYPLSQSSIVVSGIWGILVFKEVRGRAIHVFVAFCVFLFTGLVFLVAGSGAVG